MDELALKIYESLQVRGQYNYSSDPMIKTLEQDAAKQLEFDGYIIIKSEALGYFLAEVL